MRGGVTTAVMLRGTGLYNTPTFSFVGENGTEVEAPFSDPTLESILVGVPEGAITGPIKVITDGGGEARAPGDFVVVPAVPQIGDYDPKAGLPGTQLTITAALDAQGKQTKFEAIKRVTFLANPDGLGEERRINVEFKVSGDRRRITVRVPFGAVTGNIRVTNESGSGATAKFRIPLNPPSSLTATAVPGPKINLVWKDITTTESGFKLERKVGDATYSLLVTLGKDVSTFSDTNVIPGATHCYRLIAFNEKDGDSLPSNEACATAGGALRVDPIRIGFTATQDGMNPASRPLKIDSVSGLSSQPWKASVNVPWLKVSPEMGTTPAETAVTADIFGLKASSIPYKGDISIQSAGTGGSLVTVPVELSILQPPAPPAPQPPAPPAPPPAPTPPPVAPAISGFVPGSGLPGEAVTISGGGFVAGATSVAFNGIVAIATVQSPMQIAAVVPFGATTGPIGATVQGRSVTSSQLFVVPAQKGKGMR